MSSILDALEKAHRKRPKPGTGLAPDDLAEAERRERLVRDETIRHRRTFLLLMAGLGLLAMLLFIAISALVYLAIIARDKAPSTGPAPMVAVAPPVEVEATPTSSPTPMPEQTAISTPAPEIVPEPVAAIPEPVVLPAPAATPDPTPTPSPTPEPSPTPSPTPAARFAHMQVVYDAELGVKIRGVIADGASSVIMIDDSTVSLGRRYGKIRPIRIENRMIEAEYDQDGDEITIFIRW